MTHQTSAVEKSTTTTAPLTINSLLSQDIIKKRFEEILGQKAPAFISSIISATKANPALAKCDPNSVISSAVIAATLDLPIQSNLGFAAIVPYNESYKDTDGQWKKRSVAQFQMMTKGFIQLAHRTGEYKHINVAEIYAGELVSYNRVTGEVIVDEAKKTSNEIIGYVSYFKLLNGFEKYLYMNVAQVREHGEMYSKSFKSTSSQWQINFPAMAKKTLLKLNISKYGPLRVDTQLHKGMVYDEAVVKDIKGESFEYVDSKLADTYATADVIESTTNTNENTDSINANDL